MSVIRLDIENHLGLEWLNAMALPDQLPDRRLREVEAQGATLEGHALIQKRRANFLLEGRPERNREGLVVAVVLSLISMKIGQFSTVTTD